MRRQSFIRQKKEAGTRTRRGLARALVRSCGRRSGRLPPLWQQRTNVWRRLTNPAQGTKRPIGVIRDHPRSRLVCPMKPTIKIRFTEPQITLVMRAHPNCNLDHLSELSFEFDQAGKIVDCSGTIKDGGNVGHDYAGSGLARLYESARGRLTAPRAGATILQFPNGERLATRRDDTRKIASTENASGGGLQ
jgi:hypothetical protein